MSSVGRDAVIKNTSIFKPDFAENPNDPYSLLDETWLKTSFMISDSELSDQYDLSNRYWSTASSKFTDGRIGGNFGINNAPQYTPYCDFPVKGRMSGRKTPTPWDSSGNYGMGDYYSYAVDDPKQTIYMRMGVPQFNSLLNYLTNAFDPNQSTIARTGRMPSAIYDASKMIGTFFAVSAAPAIALTILGARVVSFFFNRQTSKFYTMRPTMHLYWAAVNTLVNTLAVNSGIFPKITNFNQDDTQKLGRPFNIDQDYLSSLSRVMPDVFSDQNYFDIHSIANRAQRLANQIHEEEYNRMDSSSPTDFTGYLRRELTGDGRHSTAVMDKSGNVPLSKLIDATLKFSKLFKSEEGSSQLSNTDPRLNDQGKFEKPSFVDEYAKYLDAEFRMGSQFAAFNVDYTGPVTTAFSNQTTQSELATKLNQKSSAIRDKRFSLAEGNLLGSTVTSVQETVGEVVTGLVNGVTLDMGSFIKGILGDGYVDIPEHWSNSAAELPRTSYSATFKATYNTPISRVIKCYIPISMLLAAALPLATGKQSYTSPFLCQVFDKGGAQIRLGMITSLSITAGAGANIGFDAQRRPLSFEANWVIKDLSSVVHMPLSSNSIGGIDMTLDEDNILSDYLAVLASQDIYTQIYPMEQARLRLAKLAIARGKWGSPAFWASATYSSATSGVLQYLTLGAGNALEAVVRGAEITNNRFGATN